MRPRVEHLSLNRYLSLDLCVDIHIWLAQQLHKLQQNLELNGHHKLNNM